MAKKLKDYYGTACARLLAEKLSQIVPRFPVADFVALVRQGIRGQEFLARQDVYVDAFKQCLGDDASRNLRLFRRILGPKLAASHGMFREGWWLWPIGRYVERHGTKDWAGATRFIYELTQRFTGEFAIRPLLEARPEATLALMLEWSRDGSVHVRRLASEGLRPRLPWARKSRIALDYPDQYRAILSELRHDPERFVQKSVGNNLNDLMREAPGLARSIIREWQQEPLSPATEWIIRHGTRSQRKPPARAFKAGLSRDIINR